jgi:hypothetical protein
MTNSMRRTMNCEICQQTTEWEFIGYQILSKHGQPYRVELWDCKQCGGTRSVPVKLHQTGSA